MGSRAGVAIASSIRGERHELDFTGAPRILNVMVRCLFVLAFAATPVLAEPAAKPATCKRVVVGRHVVCEYRAPVIVKVTTPKPNVMIVARDGRAVVGRPKSDDRLAGLHH